MITSLIVSSIVFIILGSFILGFESISYGLGLFVGGINSIFNSFQFIGADCVLIISMQTLFYVSVPLLIVLFIRNRVKI